MTYSDFSNNLDYMDNAVKKAAACLATHPFKTETYRLDEQLRDLWVGTLHRSVDTDQAKSVQFGLVLYDLRGGAKPEFRVNCYDQRFEVENSFLSVKYSESTPEQKITIAKMIPTALDWFDSIVVAKSHSVLEFTQRIQDRLEEFDRRSTVSKFRSKLRIHRWSLFGDHA